MAFTAEQARIPTSLGDVSVVLTDYTDSETQDTASADIQLCESGGSIFKVVSGILSTTCRQIGSLGRGNL